MARTSNNKMLSAQIEAGLAPLNRRAFLKAGLGAAVTVSSVLTLGCASETPLNPALKVLTPSQQQLFQRLITVLLPATHSKLIPATSVPVLENIDHLFASIDPKALSDLSAATTLFEYGSVLLGGHFSRFTRLEDADAITYIESWQNGNSIQRGIATSLKKLVYASYWRDEKTWPPVEFDGPVSDRWKLPSLGNAPLPAE